MLYQKNKEPIGLKAEGLEGPVALYPRAKSVVVLRLRKKFLPLLAFVCLASSLATNALDNKKIMLYSVACIGTVSLVKTVCSFCKKHNAKLALLDLADELEESHRKDQEKAIMARSMWEFPARRIAAGLLPWFLG